MCCLSSVCPCSLICLGCLFSAFYLPQREASGGPCATVSCESSPEEFTKFLRIPLTQSLTEDYRSKYSTQPLTHSKTVA
ncbi:hypothetical protein B0T09DRAFT_326211 [Sordaria sp. MPI-SDFR-AT-0083]|nr:hypothetical protein B0T09DRAFT_326211 [Sordaria sp. MPI-SDFR-AT-0083]